MLQGSPILSSSASPVSRRALKFALKSDASADSATPARAQDNTNDQPDRTLGSSFNLPRPFNGFQFNEATPDARCCRSRRANISEVGTESQTIQEGAVSEKLTQSDFDDAAKSRMARLRAAFPPQMRLWSCTPASNGIIWANLS
jgi:hypothetical protein